jgi:hypothetical protein
MLERHPLPTASPSILHKLGLQPVQAWIPIMLLAGFTALCILVKAGAILRVLFPAGTLGVGVYLYQKYPPMYVGYTLWVWFLTPFVRRLVDFQSGWQDPSPILLAPFLVTFVSVLTFVYQLPKAHQNYGIPFVLSVAGVLYGLCVGMIRLSPTAVVVPFLNWMTPVLFGFYLSTQWKDYPIYNQMIRRTFVWSVFITGIYGVFQYIIAPEWDTSWLINSGLTNSGGQPEPFKMRVFSTMHSAGPFSSVMLAGLLLLFSGRGFLTLPAIAAGYLSFLLSLVRSAWLGWGVGVLGLLTGLKPRLQIRLLVMILVAAICVVPIVSMEPFAGAIRDRLGSFSDLKTDVSFNDRRENYDLNLNQALAETMGRGLGGSDKNIDSAILDTLFSLGWLGTLLYVSGLVYGLLILFGENEFRSDLFANTARAICLSMGAMLIFSSQMVGLSGIVFWGFIGIGIAANRYYKQRAFYAKNNFKFVQSSSPKSPG